jgi:hypothetical protein
MGGSFGPSYDLASSVASYCGQDSLAFPRYALNAAIRGHTNSFFRSNNVLVPTERPLAVRALPQVHLLPSDYRCVPFWPIETTLGLQMGANALIDLYTVGFLKPMMRAPALQRQALG